MGVDLSVPPIIRKDRKKLKWVNEGKNAVDDFTTAGEKTSTD